MQLNQFQNGIECHVNKVQNNIRQRGLHVQHEGSYSYTVGMNDSELPDIIVHKGHGLSDGLIENIFLSILDSCTKETFVEKLSEMNVVFNNLDELEKRRSFYAARLYYGHWNFDAISLEVRKSEQ